MLRSYAEDSRRSHDTSDPYSLRCGIVRGRYFNTGERARSATSSARAITGSGASFVALVIACADGIACFRAIGGTEFSAW